MQTNDFVQTGVILNPGPATTIAWGSTMPAPKALIEFPKKSFGLKLESFEVNGKEEVRLVIDGPLTGWFVGDALSRLMSELRDIVDVHEHFVYRQMDAGLDEIFEEFEEDEDEYGDDCEHDDDELADDEDDLIDEYDSDCECVRCRCENWDH